MIVVLDYIVIVVFDLEVSIKCFMEDFGFKFEGIEDVEVVKILMVFFLLFFISIELVYLLCGEGSIVKYLEKKIIFKFCNFINHNELKYTVKNFMQFNIFLSYTF